MDYKKNNEGQVGAFIQDKQYFKLFFAISIVSFTVSQLLLSGKVALGIAFAGSILYMVVGFVPFSNLIMAIAWGLIVGSIAYLLFNELPGL